jgi:hypothetical protein
VFGIVIVYAVVDCYKDSVMLKIVINNVVNLLVL